MVVPPHRDGGQAQYIRTPVPACDAETLGPLLGWVVEHLEDEHTVESLAAAAHMSPRTFARRFRAETGTTPHSWVTRQRLLRAEELLETTDRSVGWIAGEVGFGTAAMLRHHFTKARSVSPQQFRRAFCSLEPRERVRSLQAEQAG
jgi:transcriptional regulator GlxA family with amidase domain